MRKSLLLAGLLLCSLACNAQKWERQGNNFVNKSNHKESNDKATKYKAVDDGKTYTIYQSNSGSCYYLKVSKVYMGTEVSSIIANETGTSYTPRSNKVKPVLSQPKNKFKK